MPQLVSIAVKIIQEQALVIGPLAWNEAGKVRGLSVDSKSATVIFTDQDQKSVIDSLVAQYERLFGRASHEVCKAAVADLVKSMSPAEIPVSLR